MNYLLTRQHHKLTLARCYIAYGSIAILKGLDTCVEVGLQTGQGCTCSQDNYLMHFLLGKW
jgi:hypothetical protein